MCVLEAMKSFLGFICNFKIVSMVTDGDSKILICEYCHGNNVSMATKIASEMLDFTWNQHAKLGFI